MAGDAQPDPRIGQVLDDRYRIDVPIASGGMGVVYRAERIGIGKRVAIKFLHDHAAADPDSVKRFEREAEAMSRVTHPNLASVIDHGVDQGTPYLVMEYHPGDTLADLIERGPIPGPRAVAIARQIVSGMGGIHAAGIVHRDLKPDNVVLLADLDHDFAKILDFGIAKMISPREGEADMTAVGHAIGTPSYMSPEQACGMKLDARSDLYAFGVILFEMVTGTRPFVTDEKLALLRMHVEDAPPSPRAKGAQISEELEAVILKLLKKTPAGRYDSAADVAAALLEVPEGSATPVRDSVATPLPTAARAETPTVVEKTPPRTSPVEEPVPRRRPRETSDRTEDVRTYQRKREHRRGTSWGVAFLFLLVGIALGFVLRDPRITSRVRGMLGMQAPVDAGVDAPRDAAIDAPRDAAIDAPADAAIDAAPPDGAPSDALEDAGADAL